MTKLKVQEQKRRVEHKHTHKHMHTHIQIAGGERQLFINKNIHIHTQLYDKVN